MLSRRIAILRASSSDDKTLKSLTRYSPIGWASSLLRPPTGTEYRLLWAPGEDKIFPFQPHAAKATLLFARTRLSLAFARQTLT